MAIFEDRQSQKMQEEKQCDQELAFILKQIKCLKAEETEQQRQKGLAAERLMTKRRLRGA